ncbi:DUF1287 domain-containing protein [Labilibaculum filiforme]|uniref:DUF1287 domain-containing protein n=1 Tax=Labilibaculum filiforme TaxID=1940526 RepID=A0A2N3HUK9_9BACT|nr:DUF1287 domain-containing protein [Labilibaculum filiforme]PKQ61755.1 DUF1287 domain-containing protein [Labilibaculum filiforme]
MRTLFFILICCFLSIAGHAQSFSDRLAKEAIKLTEQRVVYDPSYFSIAYPNGDVPSDKGVCTDVVIRAYRKLGIDLQKEVHEDMKANFSLYPKIWGLQHPDKNIDHRRVPNLMRFFERHGEEKLISRNNSDYLPGDVVCWNLGGAITHIGIVINKKSQDGDRYLIVHNIGAGQVIEDCLFDFTIIGHYAYSKQVRTILNL